MDVSLNLIDLQYLTNPFEMTKIMKRKEESLLSKKDLEFYKKRIFKLTKDMLRGEKVNTKVNKAFEHYAQVCMDHFKFMDRMELIQGELKDVKSEKKSSEETFNIKETNTLMCRQKKPQRPKITDHIKIKTNRTTKPPIIPKQKKFNLKDPKFREKGLKKKNINII